MILPSWLPEILTCPQTHDRLHDNVNALIRPDGQSYPIVDGIPSLVYPSAPTDQDAKWQRFYDRFAPVYDWNERILGRILTGVDILRERSRIISLLGLQEGMSVLEVSPGPGVYQADIRSAIGHEAHYVACDLSVGMLKECQRRNYALNVALVHANGSHLPFANESFDALFHFGGINLFDEPAKAMAEFVRVVKQNGIVAWGDEGFSSSVPNGWKKRLLARMNPGYLKSPPSIPEGLSDVRQTEVFGGFGYLVVANKHP
jgi:ubiquinone/menaquinone biosynthesis C-methylase UbiE